MDALTLDQLQVFAAVADEGSFSAAARRLRRAQSAITYAVQKLEDQTGTALFDRAAYRPALTEAGRALLPRARRILEEVDDFKVQARGIAGGLEPGIALVIDSMFPMRLLVDALDGFQARFPSVQTRILVETLGATVQALIDGAADLGLVTDFASRLTDLERTAIGAVDLVPVAAPGHPLARLPGPLGPEILRDHVQIVLTDRSSLTAGQDYGVVAVNTWRVADLGAKHAMLLAGLGWGSMPDHMVEADLSAGRLVRLVPGSWDGQPELPRIQMVLARRRDQPLGPAGQWIAARLRGEEPE